MTREWDADTYERVSGPMEAMALRVLDRLDLDGSETVIDAGCGGGRVTRRLVERLPGGKVVAVDSSVAMIESVRRVLRGTDEAHVADLLAFAPSEPAGAVFSTATFHWILDHDALFERIGSWLEPGGRLEAQCGGPGNVAEIESAIRTLASEEPFATCVDPGKQVRYFATPSETAARMARNGFQRVRCWLENETVRPDDPLAYLTSICCGAHLLMLPAELQEPFLERVLASLGELPGISYVRLNISARKGAG